MKRLMNAIALSLAVCIVNGSDLTLQNATAALTDGLVAYYPLDGDANDLALGNHATINGEAVDFQAGKVGQAVNLDRLEGAQWLSVTGTDLFGNTGLTQTDTSASAYSMQAWINPDLVTIGGTPGDGYIVASTLSTVDNHGFAVSARVDGSSQLDAFVQKPAASGFSFETNGNHPLPASQDGWYHVLVTWDSQIPTGPGELKVYIDNTLISTVLDSVVPNSRAMATDGLNIGADQIIGPNATQPGRFYDGLLDEIAIWDRVLTEAERTALYNNGAGRAIPEPTTVALLFIGLAVSGFTRRKRS